MHRDPAVPLLRTYLTVTAHKYRGTHEKVIPSSTVCDTKRQGRTQVHE